MNGHPFRRAVALFGLYALVLCTLVVVQFSRRSGFTLTEGSLAISGRYADGDSAAAASGERALSGPLAVFFGGMEFRLSGGDGMLSTVSGGAAQEAMPVSMKASDNSAAVRLSDGSVLLFRTAFSGGAETLQVSASLGRSVQTLRLPYRPLRSSRMVETEGGGIAFAARDGSYSFRRATVDAEKRALVLNPGASSFSYGKIVPQKAFSPAELAMPQAADKSAFDRAVLRWRDLAQAGWERAMAGSPDEETIVAYVAESNRRGGYRSAVATAPKPFVDGAGRTFLSTVYFGRLDEALRSLSADERETLGRLSRLANERNLDLFAERDLIAYLAVRASRTIADDVAAFARAVDPSSVTPTLAAGFLECWADWKKFRPADANPFDTLVDQSRFVLSGVLKKSDDGIVLPLADGVVDTAFALRAGRALARSAEAAKDETWLELGRTLTLSVLSLADSVGSVPAALQFAPPAAPVPSGQARLSAARIYRMVAEEDRFPRAVPLAAEGGAPLWAWTAASSVAVSREAGVLDLAVTFAAGETHYMMIRGLKPFAKIQLYGIDFRTDPRFERYDSSGWAYSASEQTLILKMKHKMPVEQVRIYFEAP